MNHIWVMSHTNAHETIKNVNFIVFLLTYRDVHTYTYAHSHENQRLLQVTFTKCHLPCYFKTGFLPWFGTHRAGQTDLS